jgi:uncharacterized membrane protein YdjX (TVP38/TMEM64 family)
LRSKIFKLAVLTMLVGVGSFLAATGGVDFLRVQTLLRQSSFAPLVFVALHVTFSLLFLPRAVMAIAAGLVFGLWSGLLWATMGSLIGGLSGFWLARYLAADVVAPSDWPRFASVMRRVEKGGWRAVAMLRLIPVLPHSPTNYLLGLSSLGAADFALGSLLGQAPMTFAFVQFGNAGAQAILDRPGWLWPTLFGVAALLLSMLPQFWQRALRRQ